MGIKVGVTIAIAGRSLKAIEISKSFIMKIFITRLIVSIGVFALFFGPYFYLAKLSNDVRNFGFLDFYIRVDSKFPPISKFLWRLGPIAWWSYLTPFFLAIGIAFRFRHPIALSSLLIYLFVVIINLLILISAFDPYGKLYKVVGNSVADSLDPFALMVNISAVILTLIFCALSIRLSLLAR